MQPLAEQGVVEAQYQMAFLLCLGDGVTKNEDACMAGWGKQPGRATPKPSTVTVACCRKKRPRRRRSKKTRPGLKARRRRATKTRASGWPNGCERTGHRTNRCAERRGGVTGDDTG